LPKTGKITTYPELEENWGIFLLKKWWGDFSCYILLGAKVGNKKAGLVIKGTYLDAYIVLAPI